MFFVHALIVLGNSILELPMVNSNSLSSRLRKIALCSVSVRLVLGMMSETSDFIENDQLWYKSWRNIFENIAQC